MDSFEQRYPHVAAWVQDGIVEIGNTDYDSSFIRVLDEGGMIWSTTDAYPSLDSALAAADAAIAEWCSVHIPDLVVGATVSLLLYAQAGAVPRLYPPVYPAPRSSSRRT